MKVFISQSNYIPWKGYFDAINLADVFVLYDDMQFTKGDWRNRNKIKTSDGLHWLSIPIKVKGKYLQKINEAEVQNHYWRKKHWLSIQQSYHKAPFFKEYKPLFEELYLSGTEERLSMINYNFLIAVAGLLGISTRFVWSSEFGLKGDKSEKLLNICKVLNATHYISGPSARVYLDVGLFNENNIEVAWMDYSAYSEYPQLFSPFEEAVSILDLLFNTGPAATSFMKTF